MRDEPKTDALRDPAAEAAAVLLRIGFALLLIAAPVASVGSRRAYLVLAPLGISLVLLSTLIDGRGRHALTAALRFIASPVGVAVLFLLVWALISLTWTSARTLGLDRLVKIGGTLALAVVACVSLPARMRATNLYLIPIGVALAALLVIAAASYGLLPFRAFDPDQPTLDRAAAAISMQLFAAFAWLMTKRRPAMAGMLGGLVLLATFVAASENSAVAILAGALVVLAGHLNPRLTARLVAVGAVCVIMLSPLLAVLLRPYAHGLPFLDGDSARSLDVWGRIVASDPLRMITGRGVESTTFDRIGGRIGLEAPHSMLFEIWYEFGILGAGALAVFIAAGALRVAELAHGAAPYMLGGLVCAVVLGCLGLGTVQTWWMTTLCLAAVAFAGVNNGQYRSSRPRAAFARRTAVAG